MVLSATDARREVDPCTTRATPRSVAAVGHARSSGLRDYEGRASRLDPGARLGARKEWRSHERVLSRIQGPPDRRRFTDTSRTSCLPYASRTRNHGPPDGTFHAIL